jgi:hypothetical protein
VHLRVLAWGAAVFFAGCSHGLASEPLMASGPCREHLDPTAPDQILVHVTHHGAEELGGPNWHRIYGTAQWHSGESSDYGTPDHCLAFKVAATDLLRINMYVETQQDDQCWFHGVVETPHPGGLLEAEGFVTGPSCA